MPDRELTEEETRNFVHEHVTGKVFRALGTFKEERTKPSLHDLCILELIAVCDALKEILIQQGRAIRELQKK